jgi:hypothetical protein
MVYNIKNLTYNTMGVWQFMATLAGGGLGAKVLDYGVNAFKARKETRPAAGLEKLNRVYDQMSEITNHTQADRVGIYVLENSGGKNVPGNPQYLTMIYEDFQTGKGLTSTKEMFRKFLIDKSLTKVFNDACVNGVRVVEHPTDMGDETNVSDTMKLRKMKYSQVFFICQTETKSFFMGVSSTEGEYTTLPENDKITIRMTVEKIRAIFKEGIKYLR